jgi:signal transduction histidine kinase
LATLAMAAALPLLILAVWLFSIQLRNELRESRDEALRIAKASAARLRSLHVDSTLLLQRMASRPAIRAANPRDCDSLFAIVDFFPQYANLFLVAPAGRVICSATPQPADRLVSDLAREWIEAEAAAGRLAPGRPYMRYLAGVWATALAAPVAAEDGTHAGVLVLIQLPDIGAAATLPPGSLITIIDRDGTILARSTEPEKWLGRSARGSEVTEIVLRDGEGRAAARGVDGVSRQYGFSSIPEIGWYVYVGVPTATIMKPVRALLLRAAIGGAIILLLGFVAAFALSRFVERPINALAEASQSVARQGYGMRVPVDGPREIADLGEAFNQMVESRSAAEARIVASEQNLKALSDRLLTIQEDERRRIAREIHDDLGQALTALKMDIGGLLSNFQGSDATRSIRERVSRTLDGTVQSVQRISAELRPSTLDDLGLTAAIESEARLFEERTGIECDVSLAPGEVELTSTIETAVYRVTQEALTNVARHSDASRVELRLRTRADELLLEIRDDGRGITTDEIEKRSSLGLIGMRERAAIVGGTVHFQGVEGRGTIVTVRIPLRRPA